MSKNSKNAAVEEDPDFDLGEYSLEQLQHLCIQARAELRKRTFFGIDKIRIGDTVKFESDRAGMTIEGVVIQTNQKSISVRPTDPMLGIWRVGFDLIIRTERVKPGAKLPAPPPRRARFPRGFGDL
jgi:hypothetical protein